MLSGAFAHDPSRRERFEQEARSVAALNHPNSLALHDVGTEGHMAFMVTELVDGESLREAALTPRKVLEVAAQMPDGLAAEHAAGVTHRDLKPENVMVTRDGRPKILDFGLAKEPDPAMTRIRTDGGMVLGTVGYMAPEQVRGAAVDARTDISPRAARSCPRMPARDRRFRATGRVLPRLRRPARVADPATEDVAATAKPLCEGLIDNRYRITPEGARVAMFYARLYTRALRQACSLQPDGSTRAQRTFDRLDAALANVLEDIQLAA